MKTPWQHGGGLEFGEQVALFQWANMAASFGLTAANDPKSYTVPGRAAQHAYLERDTIPVLHRLHSIKNAGHGDAVRGARSAAEGVKAGVPDVFLPVQRRFIDNKRQSDWHYAGLYIELKRVASKTRKAGIQSNVQSDWQEYLQGAGYHVQVCFGWEAARDCLLDYLKG